MGPPHQWGPTRGSGGPIPLPARHPPAALLPWTHVPGGGTIPFTDHTPSFRGRHCGGDRHRPSAPTNHTKVLHDVTNYLQGNLLLVHNVKSATMVHNAPPPPLRPGDPPMNPVSTATYPPTTKPDTAVDTDNSHSAHRGALHPGPGILPTSGTERSYRVPGPACNAPQNKCCRRPLSQYGERGPSTATDPRHYLRRCTRRHHYTMGTTPITWSATHTRLTPRPTCTISCTIMNRRWGTSSHRHYERPNTIATPVPSTYFINEACPPR